MINSQCDIEAILDNWGLKPIHWEQIKDVFKVTTNSGLKNLKVSPLRPERLVFVHQAVGHLFERGFAKMNPLLPTRTGATYFSDGQYAYSLFDWIEGRQCHFHNLSELTRSTQILAEFHQKSTGFDPPPRSHTRRQLGKCLLHFERHYQDLLEFLELAKALPLDPFAQLYLKHAPFFLPMAARAIKNLKTSRYWDLVAKAQFDKTFCHGDPAARNFILTPDDRVMMIDFDSCRIDLPIMDLIKFTRRVLKKYRWDPLIARLIADAYLEVETLSEAELAVIKAIYFFPQKFWRFAVRHFHAHQRHTSERSLQKFQKYLELREALAYFQQDFNNYLPIGRLAHE